MSAGTWVAVVLMVALTVSGIRMGWSQWRRRGDLPWSERLGWLAFALFWLSGLVTVSVLVVGISNDGPLVTTALVSEGCMAAVWVAGRLMRSWEGWQTKRARRALGLPVQRWLLPPWLLGTLWFSGGWAFWIGGLYLMAWSIQSRDRAENVPFDLASGQQAANTLGLIALVGTVLGGWVHVLVQRRRKRSENLRVRSLEADMLNRPVED